LTRFSTRPWAPAMQTLHGYSGTALWMVLVLVAVSGAVMYITNRPGHKAVMLNRTVVRRVEAVFGVT
jgi:hypothetical protein